MARELAFTFINPYTLLKSRTGGIISLLIRQTGLELVMARMFCPSRELVDRYATLLDSAQDIEKQDRELLAEYVRTHYAPDEAGNRQRVLVLFFEGEDAIAKVAAAAGKLRLQKLSSRTVRDLYGDYIVDDDGGLIYFEPALFYGKTEAEVRETLSLWTKFSESDGGLRPSAQSAVDEEDVEKVLVMIKPDNFQFPSERPGNIINFFSRSGLYIVAAQVHRFSVAEAEEFYAPVREVLRKKLHKKVVRLSSEALETKLSIDLPEETRQILGDELTSLFVENEFYKIVKFITGRWIPDVAPEEKSAPGTERCLVLVYQGRHAVRNIRSILGPTDPAKAMPGQVRREYAQDIMRNAAHASDSAESATREIGIVKPERNHMPEWYSKYYK